MMMDEKEHALHEFFTKDHRRLDKLALWLKNREKKKVKKLALALYQIFV